MITTQPSMISMKPIRKYKTLYILNYWYNNAFLIFLNSGVQSFIDCEIIAISAKYFPRPRAWAFNKHSPYTHLFDFYLRQFIEKGHYNALEVKYQERKQQCQDIGTLPIDFRICISAFLVLILGLSLSFISLLVETVVNNIEDWCHTEFYWSMYKFWGYITEKCK